MTHRAPSFILSAHPSARASVHHALRSASRSWPSSPPFTSASSASSGAALRKSRLKHTTTAAAMAHSANNGAPASHPASPAANHPQHAHAYRGEILCNRALNMSKIKAIGFDMDYTLAMYHSEEFETLAATSALHKLVHNLGYPNPLLNLRYDHSFFIRGLVVDKEMGNILKLDRHKYVKRAMHGTTIMDKEARAHMYDHITQSGGGFGEPRFAVLDAMFALPDAFLFSSLVAHKDANPSQIAASYAQIYKDVRRSVDMCHRDGSIKDVVAKDPQRYVQQDETLIPMLRRLRKSGRKVFLLTNSLWNYTDTVMSFLYGDEGGKWIDLFDVIITGSAKPAFMLDTRIPLYRCDPATGMLSNTDGVYEESASEYLGRGKCFQGGNFTHLHDMLEVSSGNQVLYVGDHIFSDVLRSKRTLGWRTMLVVPEVEREINTLYRGDAVELREEIEQMREQRDELDELVDRLEGFVIGDGSEADRADKRDELGAARKRLAGAREEIAGKLEQYHRLFHATWGQLFKTGQQNSRFAMQVESYACLYTSRVTNIGLVSPEVYWRAMSDLMPHDRLELAPMHRMLTMRAEADMPEG